VPGIVAAVTSITGVLNLLVALLPRERHRLHRIHEVLPVALSASAVAIVAVSGLLLWRLGTMLRRRKRRAWRAALVLCALLVIAHVPPIQVMIASVRAGPRSGLADTTRASDLHCDHVTS
jgi:lysyl-tRNA synthetase class 2